MLVLVFHCDFKAAHLTVQTATLRGQKVDIECDHSKRVELYCFANVLADIAYPLWSGGIESKIPPHFIEINQTHSFSSQAVFKYSSKSSDLYKLEAFVSIQCVASLKYTQRLKKLWPPLVVSSVSDHFMYIACKSGKTFPKSPELQALVYSFYDVTGREKQSCVDKVPVC